MADVRVLRQTKNHAPGLGAETDTNQMEPNAMKHTTYKRDVSCSLLAIAMMANSLGAGGLAQTACDAMECIEAGTRDEAYILRRTEILQRAVKSYQQRYRKTP